MSDIDYRISLYWHTVVMTTNRHGSWEWGLLIWHENWYLGNSKIWRESTLIPKWQVNLHLSLLEQIFIKNMNYNVAFKKSICVLSIIVFRRKIQIEKHQTKQKSQSAEKIATGASPYKKMRLWNTVSYDKNSQQKHSFNFSIVLLPSDTLCPIFKKKKKNPVIPSRVGLMFVQSLIHAEVVQAPSRKTHS